MLGKRESNPICLKKWASRTFRRFPPWNTEVFLRRRNTWLHANLIFLRCKQFWQTDFLPRWGKKHRNTLCIPSIFNDILAKRCRQNHIGFDSLLANLAVNSKNLNGDITYRFYLENSFAHKLYTIWERLEALFNLIALPFRKLSE